MGTIWEQRQTVSGNPAAVLSTDFWAQAVKVLLKRFLSTGVREDHDYMDEFGDASSGRRTVFVIFNQHS
jgi:hypothetical protein